MDNYFLFISQKIAKMYILHFTSTHGCVIIVLLSAFVPRVSRPFFMLLLDSTDKRVYNVAYMIKRRFGLALAAVFYVF